MKKEKQKSALLAIYDVSGIQDYIFATNHLKENIGASLIVTEALNECLPKALDTVLAREKTEKSGKDMKVVTDWKGQKELLFQMNENKNIEAEIIYIGGGNALVVYRNEKFYNEVSREFAKLFYQKTKYLSIITVAEKTDFRDFFKKKQELSMKLEKVKGKLIRQQPLSMFPIVEQEPIYGYPVNSIVDGTGFSSIQGEKQKEYDNAKKFAPFELKENIFWAKEMEELTTQRGQDSFVAVVHIDGNGMGDMFNKRMKEVGMDYCTAVPAVRKLSMELSDVYNGIYKKIIDYFQNRSQYWKKRKEDIMEKDVLPIRHVIMDGDDVTFICNAKLAIPIVAIFLRLLMKEQKEENLSACAGIAFVHSHYPFRLAYQIAESCCGNAKKQWYQEQKKPNPSKRGYFDFQLVRGAGQAELDLIRRENFICPNEAITRPYYVSIDDKNIEKIDSFEFLNQLMSKLPEEEMEINNKIVWPRNRLKKLYEAYLQGEEAVKFLKAEYKSRGYDFQVFSDDEKFSLFDGLELMDCYDRGLFQDFFKVYDEKVQEG